MTRLDKSLKNVDLVAETLAALFAYDTKTDAARALEISPQALQDRIQRYDLQKYVDQVAEEAVEVLKKNTIKAALNLSKKIDHQNPQISMEASKEVLDRAGVTKPKELSQTNVQVNNFGQVVGNLKKSVGWEDEEQEIS